MTDPRPSWWRRPAGLTALFLCVSVGFVAYRRAPFLVYNDSCYAWSFSSEAELTSAAETSQARMWSDPRAALAELFAPFAHVHGGYRPVERVYTAGCLLLHRHRGHDWPLLAIVGAIHGLLAVTVFCTARRFVRRDLTAAGAVLLVLASPALVASSWVYLSPQALVPLAVCAALLCYWKAQESAGRPLYLAALALLLLAGPWYREVLLFVPVLIGFLELQRARRPTPVLLLAALGFAHGLYPTALLHVCLLPELEVPIVFHMGGSLSGALSQPLVRWTAAWSFVPQFPPSLLVVAGLVPVIGAARVLRTFDRQALGQGRPAERLARAGALVSEAIAPAAWLLAIAFAGQATGVVLCLGFAVAAARRLPFLSVWFVVFFVPLLRVYTIHIHFLYAVVPAGIILAATLEDAWDRLPVPGRRRARAALAGVLLLGAADQGLNLYGAYRVNRDTYTGIQLLGQWFRARVPQGAAVVGNAMHLGDIRCAAGYHIRAYYSVPWYEPSVADPDQFRALLRAQGDRKVYLLDVDFDYPPVKWAHRNAYVHYLDVPKRDLGLRYTSVACYYYLDPLRRWLPREQVLFLGAPDLVNDFYRGPAPDGRPFCHVVGASYRVYEVTGDVVRPLPVGPAALLQKDFHGFNLFRVGYSFHAIPDDGGELDAERLRRGDYRAQFSGLSVEDVRRQILAAAGPR